MAELNPYAPPTVDTAAPPPADGAKPSFKLYSPGQVFLAGFLGAPIAGLYLLSENRKRLGHPSVARATLIGGVVATAVLFIVSFLVPSGVGRVLPAVVSMSLWHYAKQDQPLIDAHKGKGGQVESTWKAAGIGLASMVGLLTLLVLISVLIGES